VVVEDTQAPTITLQGSGSMILEIGDNYIEEGAWWSDVVDGT
jgi:hypothetical protein